MTNNTSETNNTSQDAFEEKVCDLRYLEEIMGNKKHLIKSLLGTFLEQISEELRHINDAIVKSDYVTIKNLAHTMKSTISIMGITSIASVLQEMEMLGTMAIDIEKIKELNETLNIVCKKAINEIQAAKANYE